MTENTTHARPRLKTIDPQGYTFVSAILPAEELGLLAGMNGLTEQAREYVDRMREARKWSREHSDSHGKHGNCDLCGAWFKTGAIYKNEETGRSLTIGWQCEEKVFGAGDKHTLARHLHDVATKALKTRKAKAELREKYPTLEALLASDVYFTDSEFEIVLDLRGAFSHGKKISGKQVALLADIIERATKRHEERLQREEAEKALLRPVPETDKRVTVEGEVLAVKSQESAYGTQWKMLVKVEARDGGFFKLWGTIPASVSDAAIAEEDARYEAHQADYEAAVEAIGPDTPRSDWPNPKPFERRGLRDIMVGRTVRFVARVTRSDRDESFGFWSRPTKAELGPAE